ncbi:MAG: type II toxin-antitoxin system HicB family antitoxin [Carboxydocellales bacterium]
MKNELDKYNELEYLAIIRPINEEDGGGFLAEIPALKGCFSDGETQEEALLNLKDAKLAWLRTALKRGQKIPLPDAEEKSEEYSGKFTLRLSKAMHKELALAAQKENLSLNQYIISLLSFNFGKAFEKSQNDNSHFTNQVVVYNVSGQEEGIKADLRNRFAPFNLDFESNSSLGMWGLDTKQEVAKWKR